jgi:hypothetical protein
VVTAVHKFDLQLATKETPNKWREAFVKKKLRDAVIRYHALDRIYTFSFDIRGKSQRPLPTP